VDEPLLELPPLELLELELDEELLLELLLELEPLPPVLLLGPAVWL